MKIIDNQNTRLIDEVKQQINSTSKVYLSCNFFTAFALYELIDTLKDTDNIKILLGGDVPFDKSPPNNSTLYSYQLLSLQQKN